MRRLVAAGAAFAMAAVGSIGLAGPVGADLEKIEVDWDFSVLAWHHGVEMIELEGELTYETDDEGAPAEPGDEIAVTGECNLQRLSDPRHDHEVRWALVEEGSFPGWDDLPEGLTFEAVDEGSVLVPGEDDVDDPEDVYHWEVLFEAPDATGDYEFVAACVPVDLETYDHCHVGIFGPEDLTLEVEAEEEEEEEDEEEDEVETPDAPQVPTQPSLTG